MNLPGVVYIGRRRVPAPLRLLEPLFARAAIATGCPWPADPWLRQKARAAFALARADELEAHACAKIAVAHDLLREARELGETAVHWRSVSIELQRFAARIADRSPWCRS